MQVFYKKLEFLPDTPYLGENSYITTTLDMTYEIYVVIANLDEKFVFASGQSENYVEKNPHQNFLHSLLASLGLKLSLYDRVFS